MKIHISRSWNSAFFSLTTVALIAGTTLGEIITPGDYAKSARIKFAGYTGTTALTNFPALIQFTEGKVGFRYSDLESDDYSDLRFADSSGTNSIPFEVEQWNPTLPAAASPGSIAGCLLWLKADAGIQTNAVGGVTNWVDQSANAYSAVSQATNTHPQYVGSAINGQPVVRFSGADDNYIKFPRLTTIRTVFWVIKEDADATSSTRFLLGDGSTYAFHRKANAKEIWDSSNAPLMYNGTTELNGIGIDGRTTLMPTNMSVLSVRTSGSASAETLSKDRALNGRSWDGDVAEVILYNRVLTGREMAAVYQYLENKYAIKINLDLDQSLQSSVWVRVPELTNNASIYAYWGNPAATEIPAYATNGLTWSEGYAAVYHLNSRNGNLSPDSSTNRADATINNTAAITNAPGLIGNAEQFPGGGATRIKKTLTASTWPEFTVTFWAKPRITGQPTYTSVFNNSSGNDFQIATAGTTYTYAGGATKTIGTLTTGWSFIAVTGQSAAPLTRLFFNGQFATSWAGEDASFGRFEIGCNRSEGASFDGLVDEVRISTVVRSDDWIKAVYDNQSNPSAFTAADVDYYYDTGASVGLQAGNGRWSTTNALWSATAVGSGALQPWSSGVRARFEANGTSAVTVETVVAQQLTINGTGYTLTGGTIDLAQGVVANESFSTSSSINLQANQSWLVANGKTATFTGTILGTSRLTKAGAGTLTLSAHNPFSGGVTVDAGTLLVNINNWYQNPGHGTGKLIVNAGARADFRGAHAFGSGTGGQDAHINGGTLYFQNENYVRSIELTAGLIYGGGENRAAGGNFVSYAAGQPSIISNTISMVNSKTFNVADGAAADDLIVAGLITGAGTVTKAGSGVLTTTRDNTYSGATAINAGTLRVKGSHSGTGGYSINGGTLEGTGTLASTVSFGANGGTLAPGSATGTLTVRSNVTFTASGSATNRFNVTVNSASDYSKLHVAEGGTVTLGNAALRVTLNAQIFNGKLFIIVNDGEDPIDGTFDGLAQGARLQLGPRNESYNIYYSADADTDSLSGGNDVALVPVPKGTIIRVL